MKEILRKAMVSSIPVDIYLNLSLNGQPPKCTLKYKCFKVTEIDIDLGTFSGYIVESRLIESGRDILTTDNIGLICDIYSPYFK